MVTVMLIASPPVVSQTVEDEERKKKTERQTEGKLPSFSQLKQEKQLEISLLEI